MADPVYLSVGDVWAIDDLILRAEGQISLLLNRGSLESALLRAQTAAYYQQADLVEQAVIVSVWRRSAAQATVCHPALPT